MGGGGGTLNLLFCAGREAATRFPLCCRVGGIEDRFEVLG